MRRNNQRINQGFTLIELLVVVSIIALLVSILLPALAEARRQGKLALDQANLHQIGLSMNMYAGENNNWYPPTTCAGTLFDMSYKTSNYIIKTGGDKQTFYCPLEGVKNPDQDIFWRASECWKTGQTDMGLTPEPDDGTTATPGVAILDTYGRVSGYVWLMQRLKAYADSIKAPLPPLLGDPKRDWVTKSTQRYAAETEFVTDITISDSDDTDIAKWAHHLGGLSPWGIEDKTAHLTKDEQARDGNCLYVDGHVGRKQFEDMVLRVSNLYGGFWYWWW